MVESPTKVPSAVGVSVSAPRHLYPLKSHPPPSLIMLALLLFLFSGQVRASSSLPSFPSPAGLFPFETTGDVRRDTQELEFYVGPDTAEIESSDFGLITNLEIHFQPLKKAYFALSLHTSDGENLLKTVIKPDSMQLISYPSGQNVTCKVDLKEDIDKIQVKFSLGSAILTYKGSLGGKNCGNVGFEAWNELVGWKITAAAGKPGGLVRVYEVKWEEKETAVRSIAMEIETEVNKMREKLQPSKK